MKHESFKKHEYRKNPFNLKTRILYYQAVRLESLLHNKKLHINHGLRAGATQGTMQGLSKQRLSNNKN